MVTTKRKPDFLRNLYEKDAWANNSLVCGVDEVGRSCLAGPVVAAAAILKPNKNHVLLKDSKLLTAQERLKVYKWLQKNSTFAVGIISHREINKHNIYYATLKAMKRAVIQLLASTNYKPEVILVDAMPLVIENTQVVHFCYGERQSKSIAAASIVAKVTRDALMGRMHDLFIPYNFSANKGYGTKVHRDALQEHGKLIIHREQFIRFLASTASLPL